MGYNPYRKHTATRLDYLLVVSAGLIAVGFVIWGLFG